MATDATTTDDGGERCERRVLKSGTAVYVHAPFGDTSTAFAEPAWYHGAPTPYYTAGHARLRERVRAFVQRDITPHVAEWEAAGGVPRELYGKAYAAGVLGAPYPERYGGGCADVPRWDAFCDVVRSDELCRCGSGGVLASLVTALDIALPPVLAGGNQYVIDKVARRCITGDAVIALAVTEPWAGSDVANLRTTARRDGDHYVVNGVKKFITAGMYADYYTTAVRTGGAGMGGVSLLLIERETPGVSCVRLKTQGWASSATTLVRLEDVRVPVTHLIGAENRGFVPIMVNFNAERFGGVVAATSFARQCLADAAAYSKRRRTFGKPLREHQVIRAKLAEMARVVASCDALVDQLALEMSSADARTDHARLGARIALAKVHATRSVELCAREASQVFGGNAYLRSGPGARVERIYREVRVLAIGGGSEEVLMDRVARSCL